MGRCCQSAGSVGCWPRLRSNSNSRSHRGKRRRHGYTLALAVRATTSRTVNPLHVSQYPRIASKSRRRIGTSDCSGCRCRAPRAAAAYYPRKRSVAWRSAMRRDLLHTRGNCTYRSSSSSLTSPQPSGLGIDKPHVCLLMHWTPLATPEAHCRVKDVAQFFSSGERDSSCSDGEPREEPAEDLCNRAVMLRSRISRDDRAYLCSCWPTNRAAARRPGATAG
jgi:hypothetical protein